MRGEPATVQSNWVVAVWAFMVVKWSLNYFVHLLRYHVRANSLDKLQSTDKAWELETGEDDRY
jgi:hypothetical protein